MAYAPHTPEDIKAMLAAIGAESVEQLFSTIPKNVRLSRDLDLAAGVSEARLRREIGAMAAANHSTAELVSYVGAGSYEHDIPSVVKHLALRSEFSTAYTPYQAEVSQGTLQVIYEFQTYICRLTGLPVSNASLYDGATALAEAALMAHTMTRRSRILVPATLWQAYGQVLRAYGQGWDVSVESVATASDGRMDLADLDSKWDDRVAALIVAQPNGLGILEDVDAVSQRVRDDKALLIALVDPISLAILRPPGEWGADVAVGEGQPLGIPLSFGGPQCGFIAVRDQLKRRLPGRLVGETTDTDGNRGFVLTLQTREQHIRREKATSNICTNQGLAATMATIYMSTLGRRGLTDVAETCWANANYLADGLASVEGLELPFDAPFYHEFVVRWPMPAEEALRALREAGIAGGIPLHTVLGQADPHDVLVATSELRTKDELDRYVQKAQHIISTRAAETTG